MYLHGDISAFQSADPLLPSPSLNMDGVPPTDTSFNEKYARGVQNEKFPCYVCYKGFAQEGGRENHENNIHNRVNGYWCFHCNKRVSHSAKGAKRHHRSEHAGEVCGRIDCPLSDMRLQRLPEPATACGVCSLLFIKNDESDDKSMLLERANHVAQNHCNEKELSDEDMLKWKSKNWSITKFVWAFLEGAKVGQAFFQLLEEYRLQERTSGIDWQQYDTNWKWLRGKDNETWYTPDSGQRLEGGLQTRLEYSIYEDDASIRLLAADLFFNATITPRAGTNARPVDISGWNIMDSFPISYIAREQHTSSTQSSPVTDDQPANKLLDVNHHQISNSAITMSNDLHKAPQNFELRTSYNDIASNSASQQNHSQASVHGAPPQTPSNKTQIASSGAGQNMQYARNATTPPSRDRDDYAFHDLEAAFLNYSPGLATAPKVASTNLQPQLHNETNSVPASKPYLHLSKADLHTGVQANTPPLSNEQLLTINPQSRVGSSQQFIQGQSRFDNYNDGTLASIKRILNPGCKKG